MHDPFVVAFEIRRPWPKRSGMPGRRYWWPPLVTVWHRDPGGHDSGEVCKHYVRTKQPDGTWKTRILHGWKFHLHHWKIQVHPLQAFRRWALTRCAWCGGRSRHGDYVNISHSWNGPHGRWWRGELGLYHHDCSSVSNAHVACLCADPLLDSGTYGHCALCGKRRAFGAKPEVLARQRMLAAVPAGRRDPAVWRRVCDLARDERDTAPAA